jgi:SNF2 family DNA or RNA helicase
MVYKLVAESTLEERICVMQKEKQQLTDAALREGGITHFGADDLRALFQSL